MKRILSLLLAVILLVSTLTSCSLQHFTFDNGGDSETGENGITNDGTLTVGQWLMMINDAFGMQSYISNTPYFENVPTSNPYFQTVQIAAEWDVVDCDEPLDINTVLVWETALVTLVNAGGFVTEESNIEDKICFAIEKFDSTINKKWMSDSIQYQQAVVLLATAQEKWANKRYEDNIENVSYNDNVVDLTDAVKTDYTVNGNQVAISAELVGEVKEGDVYVLQSQDDPLEYSYYKAEQISTINGVVYITNSGEDLELEEVAQEVKLQGTIIPTAENTVVCDGNGNVIAGPQIVNQAYSGDEPRVELLGYTKTATSSKHTFKVGENEVSLSYNLNGALDMKIGVKTANLLGGDDYGKLNGEASFEISNLEITRDFDYSVWSGLKSATLKVDYETKTKFGVSYSAKPIDAVAAPEYSNGNGKFLTNFKRAILKDKDGLGAKTIASKKVIKVCSLNVYNAGVAKICLDVNLQIAVDGSLSVTITQGGTTGVEYKNGNLRFVKKNSKSAQAELKAQVELTLGFGPGLYLIGLKKQLIGLEVQMGVGADASVKMHLADAEMHLIEEMSFDDTPAEDCEVFNTLSINASTDAIQAVAESQGGVYKAEAGVTVSLHIDTCFDVSVYGILKFGLTDSSYAAKFIGGKVKLTCTVFSSKNAKFFSCHVDNWNWTGGVTNWGAAANQDACTLQYKAFDEEPGATTAPTDSVETTENGDITFGEFILLSDFRGEVAVGGKYCISVTQLPAGYSMSDIMYESADKSVASVNGQGVVEGVKGGSTTIAVRTRDGKHMAVITIAVVEDNKVEFEGIEV